jgi:hypothetical protein
MYNDGTVLTRKRSVDSPSEFKERDSVLWDSKTGPGPKMELGHSSRFTSLEILQIEVPNHIIMKKEMFRGMMDLINTLNCNLL